MYDILLFFAGGFFMFFWAVIFALIKYMQQR